MINIKNEISIIKIIEPTIPLQSLGGESRNPPLQYKDYLAWKNHNNLVDFHPDRAYGPNGENRREKIIQDEERFNLGLMSVRRVLNE